MRTLKQLFGVPSGAPAPSPAWPVEIELLIACARREMTPGDRARAARVSSGADWDRVLAIGRTHRILPLLQHHVAVGAVPAPESAAAWLRDWRARHARRALELTALLATVLDVLRDAGVSAMPLKGPVLARSLFGDVALRDVVDVDVLVRPDDLALAMRALEARGYRRHAEGEPAFAAALGPRAHHLTLVAPSGIRIELHRRLLADPGARGADGLDQLLPNARRELLAGSPVPVMSDEDLLVYLSQHGASHAWARLKWIADVAQLLRDGRVRDWARVREFGVAVRGERRVDAACRLAAALFPELQAGPPDAALDHANARVLAVMAAEPCRSRPGVRDQVDYEFLTDASTGARARRLWSLAFAPHFADFAVVPLPKWARPLYGIVRPLRLAGRAAARVMRRRRRKRP